MAELLEKFSSDSFGKKNLLDGGEDRILVYVENEADVPFWKYVFSKRAIKTTVTPATKEENLARGKDVVLSFADRAGKFLILCVDSDYDYLLQEATERSKLINEHLYIFQTYTYAIENYQCFAGSLEQVITDATLQDKSQVFDYEAFMQAYSKIVYDLFVYSFFYERENQLAEAQHREAYKQDQTKVNTSIHIFKQEEFNQIVSFQSINFSDGGRQALEALSERVREKKETLPALTERELAYLKQTLEALGVKADNIYCFINGHIIQNNVVQIFLKPIVKHLKESKLQEIKEGTPNPKLISDKKKEYENQTIDITQVLRTHKYYKNSPIFAKILTDVGKYLET